MKPPKQRLMTPIRVIMKIGSLRNMPSPITIPKIPVPKNIINKTLSFLGGTCLIVDLLNIGRY